MHRDYSYLRGLRASKTKVWILDPIISSNSLRTSKYSCVVSVPQISSFEFAVIAQANGHNWLQDQLATPSSWYRFRETMVKHCHLECRMLLHRTSIPFEFSSSRSSPLFSSYCTQVWRYLQKNLRSSPLRYPKIITHTGNPKHWTHRSVFRPRALRCHAVFI